VPVEGLEWLWQKDDLELRFTLPPGSYATVLVEELFAGLEEVREGEPASKD
jgi:tRNA(Glu) U13 pseudouridine synthase TruD